MGAIRDLGKVLGTINARHDASWELVRKLPGGYSAGAHELRSIDGARAVLKVHPPVPASQVAATGGVIDSAIRAGWRTPAWFASGVLPSGEFYVVQEFIEGESATILGERELALLLVTNRVQAGLAPRTDRDWSGYVSRVVFAGGFGYAARMRQHADTADLLRRLESATAESRDLVLPKSDLVHGDFTLDNAIFVGGAAYLVDADFVGKGTRACDLAILLVQAGTAAIGASASTVAHLREECTELIGHDGMLVGVAARMIGLTDFGLRYWADDVPSFVGRCHAFLDSLGAR